MKITKFKVGYSTSIPIAMYGIKDGAWAEAEIELGEGEQFDFGKMWCALKDEVDGVVREKYPHLYDSQFSNRELIVEHKAEYPLTPSEAYTLEEVIPQCKTLQELSMYEKIIDKKPEGEEKRKLWLIHDETFQKLSNQEK